MDANPIKLKIGYVVMRHGDPVKTGPQGSRIAKLYLKPGYARRVANVRGGIVCEVFVEVPGD